MRKIYYLDWQIFYLINDITFLDKRDFKILLFMKHEIDERRQWISDDVVWDAYFISKCIEFHESLLKSVSISIRSNSAWIFPPNSINKAIDSSGVIIWYAWSNYFEVVQCKLTYAFHRLLYLSIYIYIYWY